MISIRVLLFGIMPIIAAAALLLSELRKSTVATTDWRDVTVDGRGYIHTVDERYENSIWLRSVHLGIDATGRLCGQIKGELRPLTPAIDIPSDWTKISIGSEGSVTVDFPGNVGISVGTILLTTFQGDVVDQSVNEVDVEQRLGVPMECQPSENGTGQVEQFTAQQFCLPITFRSITSLIIACLASLHIYYSFKSTPEALSKELEL
jgi:flagellar basal body rod protein FlgG